MKELTVVAILLTAMMSACGNEKMEFNSVEENPIETQKGKGNGIALFSLVIFRGECGDFEPHIIAKRDGVEREAVMQPAPVFAQHNVEGDENTCIARFEVEAGEYFFQLRRQVRGMIFSSGIRVKENTRITYHMFE